eukprot:TRINITY_DN31021_c0_g1_i1.p1 TRINITY_DN31021_c0_g1~~TRINITY_DN31021_c0_g1_i1.p1  ORF type:complete len:287 (-),score=36.61 TRINITY_DN31021_c0_g1_i1:474-1334(-)
MGSFIGHVLPGSLFLFVGLWHIWNSVRMFAENPKSHVVRVWHPLPKARGNLRFLEIYVIVFGSFLDMCIEFFYSPHLRIFVDGVLNPAHMNDFEHAGMLLMFFIFGVAMLVSEKTRYLPLPEGSLQILAAMAFLAEYLLFSFHSTTHAGLEGRYHAILVLLIGLCIISALLGAAFRTSFVVDLTNGIAITLQGLWFYQTAFSLYGPMIPSGCSVNRDGIECDSEEYEVRGQFLANFQLSMIVLSLLTSIMILFGFAGSVHSNQNLYDGENDQEVSKLNVRNGVLQY